MDLPRDRAARPGGDRRRGCLARPVAAGGCPAAGHRRLLPTARRGRLPLRPGVPGPDLGLAARRRRVRRGRPARCGGGRRPLRHPPRPARRGSARDARPDRRADDGSRPDPAPVRLDGRAVARGRCHSRAGDADDGLRRLGCRAPVRRNGRPGADRRLDRLAGGYRRSADAVAGPWAPPVVVSAGVGAVPRARGPGRRGPLGLAGRHHGHPCPVRLRHADPSSVELAGSVRLRRGRRHRS